jgi:hypothetical protein
MPIQSTQTRDLPFKACHSKTNIAGFALRCHTLVSCAGPIPSKPADPCLSRPSHALPKSTDRGHACRSMPIIAGPIDATPRRPLLAVTKQSMPVQPTICLANPATTRLASR